MDIKKEPTILYHFTCEYLLRGILKKRCLTTTRSNFSFESPDAYPVVWLTSSQTPENMGLLFDNNMPDDLNKTHIRISIRKKSYMKLWDEWVDEKGIDKQMKQVLIASASAEDTYKTWYVSQSIIPINDILVIENIKTGKIYYEK